LLFIIFIIRPKTKLLKTKVNIEKQRDNLNGLLSSSVFPTPFQKRINDFKRQELKSFREARSTKAKIK
jgi:hypothetical protein